MPFQDQNIYIFLKKNIYFKPFDFWLDAPAVFCRMRPGGCLSVACVLMLAFSAVAAGHQRPWLRHLRDFNLGALARRLQGTGGGAHHRRLTVDARSCDCVQLSWRAVPGLTRNATTESAGHLARQILPGSCLPGLQADCVFGGQLEGAPECDLGILDGEMLSLVVFRFFPSDALMAWLVSASGCVLPIAAGHPPHASHAPQEAHACCGGQFSRPIATVQRSLSPLCPVHASGSARRCQSLPPSPPSPSCRRLRRPSLF